MKRAINHIHALSQKEIGTVVDALCLLLDRVKSSNLMLSMEIEKAKAREVVNETELKRQEKIYERDLEYSGTIEELIEMFKQEL